MQNTDVDMAVAEKMGLEPVRHDTGCLVPISKQADAAVEVFFESPAMPGYFQFIPSALFSHCGYIIARNKISIEPHEDGRWIAIYNNVRMVDVTIPLAVSRVFVE